MRKMYFLSLLIACFFLLTGVTELQAQDRYGYNYSYGDSDENRPRVGLKLGTNAATFREGGVTNIHDQNTKWGFVGGLSFMVPIGSALNFNPEILYSSRGTKSQFNDPMFMGEPRFNLNYIDVPVAFNLHIANALQIEVGAYAGYLVGANVDDDLDLVQNPDDVDFDVTPLDKDHFNTWDYGVLAGAALGGDGGRIGVRYNLGLRDIANSAFSDALLGDAKHSFWQLYFQLHF